MQTSVFMTTATPAAVPASSRPVAARAAVHVAPVVHAPPSVTSDARARLEQIVSQGQKRTEATVARILGEVSTDYLAPVRDLGFVVQAEADKPGRLLLGVNHAGSEIGHSVHSHALGQIAERLEMPRAYLGELISSGEPWQHELAQHAVREHAKHSNARALVRTVGGQVRGFLSDRYRRLDVRPLLDAFLQSAYSVGAVAYEGVASDLRINVRVILPQVFEPVPGEALVYGIGLANSDYGAATYSLSKFALRLVCLNGMIGENALRKVHVGGRLEDSADFSERTYDFDQKTIASATQDIVRGLLSPATLDLHGQAIRAAHAQSKTFEQAFRGARLNKGEAKQAQALYEGAETILLPPGQTAWRASNVLSYLANQTEDADRKVDYQAQAAALVAGFAG